MRKSKYTEQDYINKCNSLGLTYISNYKKKHVGTIIEFICKKHNEKGVQNSSWYHFKDAKIGCPYCYGRNRTTKEFIELIKNKNIEPLSEYIKAEEKMKFKCLICGYIWETKPKVILNNNCGCPKCGREKANKNEMKTNDDFINELYNVNRYIKILGEYTGLKNRIKCECLKCGNIWEGLPIRLLRGEAGCPRCNLSDGERKLLMLLEDLNIKYIPQYSIDDCKNIFKLRFDAFDVENNIGFEYNGEQHYKPIYIKSKKYNPEEEFEKIKIRDVKKKEYCDSHNIPLIIIPYWEKDNMRDFLLLQFKERGLYHNK